MQHFPASKERKSLVWLTSYTDFFPRFLPCSRSMSNLILVLLPISIWALQLQSYQYPLISFMYVTSVPRSIPGVPRFSTYERYILRAFRLRAPFCSPLRAFALTSTPIFFFHGPWLFLFPFPCFCPQPSLALPLAPLTLSSLTKCVSHVFKQYYSS